MTTIPLRPANPVAQPGVTGDGRPIQGWAVEGTNPELLSGDVQSAVDDWLSDYVGEPPATVTVVGYAPMRMASAQWIADRTLEHIYEVLDEEYGADPTLTGWEPEEPTPEIRAKALELAEMIRSNYRVFWCDETDMRVTVEVDRD